uniref:Uncharacterized protein n=1 Tax=Anguilla anguilla TaxID=7936 RepID=A0A0E9R5G5_ANGAN
MSLLPTYRDKMHNLKSYRCSQKIFCAQRACRMGWPRVTPVCFCSLYLSEAHSWTETEDALGLIPCP